MIFTKQIRLVILLPILISTVVIILVAFSHWFYQSFEWIDQLATFLQDYKKQTFHLFSYVNSYSAQVEYQNAAIYQIAMTHLFYKNTLGQVKNNPNYEDNLFNSISDDEQAAYSKQVEQYGDVDEMYTNTWYDPNYLDIADTGQQRYLDTLGYNSFFQRGIMRTTYSLLTKRFFMATLASDGLTAFYPGYFQPMFPDKEIRKQYAPSLDDCPQYEKEDRKYFYEFRCDFEFENSAKATNAVNEIIYLQDVVYNPPYLYYEKNASSIINSICSRLVNPLIADHPFYGVLCIEYSAEPLEERMRNNSKVTSEDGDVRTYIIAAGSRVPLAYDSVLDNLTNIEDLEYNNKALLEEKEDFIDKTKFFQEVYNVTMGQCHGFYSLRSNKSVQYSRDQQDYYLIARNLTTCLIPDHTFTPKSSQYREQIIGTIVVEVSLLQEQIKIQKITDNISVIIQITGTISVMLIIVIVCGLKWYSQKLAEQLAEPIDDLIQTLRTVDEASMQTYFIELLQGDLKAYTPADLGLLIRAVQDFVGIVRIANEAFIQGNDSQAIIGYAVANQFYLENGNVLGAGVIQNNMGAIHMRNKRFSESIGSFRQSIEVIENEWERYKKKYMKYGVTEQELQVDQEFQKLSTIVLNRCFNLCECLSQYLLTETLVLEEHLFTPQDIKNVHATILRESDKKRLRNASSMSLEKMIYAQMNLNSIRPPPGDSEAAQIALEMDNQEDDEQHLLIPSDPEVTGIIKELLKINESLQRFRLRLVQGNDQDFRIRHSQVDIQKQVNVTQVVKLIKTLWKDTILTYRYCKYLMENQLQFTERDQKKLYIYLKIILGHLYLGQITDCDSLFDEAEDLLAELKYKQKNHQIHDDEFQYSISILEQKYYLYKGIIFYKLGMYKKAGELITRSLKCEGQYSPRDRVEALLILRTIFQSQNLDYSTIEEFLARYQIVVKDIIFVLDYGQSMCRQRNIIKALHLMNKVLELVNGPNDRIAYYLVSADVREVIPLSKKVPNEVFIHEMLQFVPQPVQYNTNVEIGLGVAIKQMLRNHHPNLLHRDNSLYVHNNDGTMTPHKRFIILLSDEVPYVVQPNHLEIKLQPFLLQKLEESHTQLLIVTFSENERPFDNSSPHVHTFCENQSQEMITFFEELEEKIELPGSNFYLEQTI